MSVLHIALVVLLTPSPDNRAGAELSLRKGNEAFRAGQVEEAIREYAKAYELFPSAKVLYNLGQAYEAIGRQKEALSTFRRFIDGVDGSDAGDSELAPRLADARLRVEALEAALAAMSPPPPKQPGPSHGLPGATPQATAEAAPVLLAPAPAEGVSRSGWRRARWWVIGASVVAVAAFATFLIVSRDQNCPSSRSSLGCI